MPPPTAASSLASTFEQACACHHQGDRQQACALFQEVLAEDPKHFDALSCLAFLAFEAEDWPAAASLLRQCLALQPEHASCLTNLALVLCHQAAFAEALPIAEQAVRLAPENPDATVNLATALKGLGDLSAAQSRLEALLLEHPDRPHAHFGLAGVRMAQQDLGAALADYDRAIALDTHYGEAWLNRGSCLQHLGRHGEAAESYHRADEVAKPGSGVHMQARFNLGLTQLLLGDYAAGWAAYALRWSLPPLANESSQFVKPRWAGEDISGQTLLLHVEQGLGDTVQFCRFVPMLAERGIRVLLEAPPPLASLLAGLPGVAGLLHSGQVIPPFDVHLPLLSLPEVLGIRLEDLPASPVPYLSVSEAKQQAWAARIGPRTHPRIGLVWRGNAAHQNDQRRSLPLAALLAGLPTEFTYFSLQRELNPEDADTLAAAPLLRHFGDTLADFSDTAASCMLMDVVLSVDTSVAHLAGALGRPVWLMLPFNPDWRWLLERSDSPWYPSARLFRQPAPGDWPAVLRQVDEALRQTWPAASDVALGKKMLRVAIDLHQKADLAKAEDWYRRCLQAWPECTVAMSNLGVLLHVAGRSHEAETLLRETLARYPEHAAAYGGLGVVLHASRRTDEAITAYRQGLALDPNDAQNWCNLAISYRDRLQHPEAIDCCRRAIALQPDYAKAHLTLGLALLRTGHFAEGWQEYEWRWQDADTRLKLRDFGAPLWVRGEPLAGKRILLHAEQGYGDTLQFCRYVPLVAALGAQVCLEVPQPLYALMQGLPGEIEVATDGMPLPQCDVQVPLLSLPERLGTTLENIPVADQAYITADPARLALWSARLGPRLAHSGPRLGIAWCGNPEHRNDANRSIALAKLLASLPANCTVISLQRELRAEDAALLAAHPEVRHFGPQIRDFADTAALCALVDAVVSVDTSVAHLAGAMARPLWLLLPCNPDWRWMLERNDSPWYGSARLRRQSEYLDWAPVLATLADELGSFLAQAEMPPPPPQPEPQSLLREAMRCLQQQELDVAETLLTDLITLDAQDFDAWHMRANIAYQRGQLEEAITALQQALRIRPDSPEAHVNLARILSSQGRHEACLAHCRQSTLAAPDQIEAWVLLAEAARQTGLRQEAADAYGQVARLNPASMEAHINQAALLAELEQHAKAIPLLEGMISRWPELAEAHCNLGYSQRQLGHRNEAMRCYRQALHLKHDYADAHHNLCNILREERQLEEALVHARQAIACRPEFALSWNSLGMILSDLGRYAESDAAYAQALKLDPQYATAHWNQSLGHLLQGRFAAGWQAYEYRLQVPSVSVTMHHFDGPRWSGQPVAGKSVLLHVEQGHGDTFQFCRYARLLAERGAQVTLLANTPTTLVLSSLAGVTVTPLGGTAPPYDYQCPLLSLPLAFQTEENTIPVWPEGYLQADPARVAYWQTRLGERTQPRIGLAWAGNPAHANDANRSIALHQWLTALPQACQLVSLQRDLRAGEAEYLQAHPEILHFGGEIADFSDTAALCSLMDVVLSVDTGVAHLAGALGRPVWILLPFAPEWRWLLERTDSPWYPSARLFRQKERGQWAPLLNEVRSALGTYLHLPPTPLPQRPPVADFHQAFACYQQGQLDEAKRICQQLLTQQPEHYDALNLLGYIAFQALALDEAEAYLLRAVRCRPESTMAHHNLANVLGKTLRLEEALASCDEALRLAPNQADSLELRGILLSDLLRFEDSIAAFEQALALQPANPSFQFSLSLTLLLLGDFERGWAAYEYRRQVERLQDSMYPVGGPRWQGEPLNGKRILLHAEQGYGDSLQFCRYIQQVAEAGAEVIFLVHRPLHPVMQAVSGVHQLMSLGDPLPKVDCQAPLMSLPFIFGTRLDSIPGDRGGYLPVDAVRLGKWAARLGTPRRPRIGIAWSGSPTHLNDLNRSMPLASMLAALPPDCDYFSLQNTLRASDAKTLAAHPELIHFGAEIADFGDLAALCALMDAVVSVDTAVAHMAGGLGRPLWLLLPYKPEWRWLLQRPDSPWYASARLRRQSVRGDWLPVCAGVRSELAEFLNATPLGTLAPDLQAQAKSLIDQNRWVEAIPLLETLLAQTPDDAHLLYTIGYAYRVDKQDAAAMAHYRRALVIQPDFADVHHNLSNLLLEQEQFEAAQEHCRQALALRPDFAQSQNTLGQALTGLRRHEEAIAAFRQSIALRPDYAEAHLNLGTTLRIIGRPDEALLHNTQAMNLPLAKPGPVLDARGSILAELFRFEAAEQAYLQSIASAPDAHGTYFNLACTYLWQGRYAEGWQHYEHRLPMFKIGKRMASFPQAVWQGEELAGKTILVHSEQGFGDTFQFVRYLPLLQQRGARVLVHSHPNMLDLLRSMPEIEQVFGFGKPLPAFDFQIAMMSLPLRFGMQHATQIPAPQGGYLQADSARVAHWAALLGPRSGPRIGLAWSGNPVHTNDHQRSMRLHQMLPMLPEECSLVCLQRELRPEDRQLLEEHPEIRFFGEQLTNFSETAALCTQMDLIISIDTGVAHLAGALGRPVWILLPFIAEWRWGVQGEDCPWYHSTRLFRQSQRGDWAGLGERVRASLSEFLQHGHLLPASLPPAPPCSTPPATFLAAYQAYVQKDYPAAQRICLALLERDPQHYDPLNLLGFLYSESGDVDTALAYLQRAIAAKPNEPSTHCNLLQVLIKAGQFERAKTHCLQALQHLPEHAELLFNLGNIHRSLKQPEAAIADYLRCLKAAPQHPMARSNLSITLNDSGRHEEALAHLLAAEVETPDDFDVLNNISVTLGRLKRHAEALEYAERALSIRPDSPDAYLGIAINCAHLDRLEDAKAHYRKAIELRPDFADAYANLGNLLGRQCDFLGAQRIYEAGLAHCPDNASLHNNLGTIQCALIHRLGPEPALRSFNRAIELNQEFAEAVYNRGLARLMAGDFAQGWADYEWRHQGATLGAPYRHRFPAPFWEGESLADKSLLIHAEQGLGDTLHFCRYAPIMAQQCQRLVFEIQAALLPLLPSLGPSVQLVPAGEPVPACDYQISLLSVPRLLGTRLDNLPASPLGYLQAPPEYLQRWLARLGPRHAPRIGLAWSGSTIHPNDRNRSLPLKDVIAALPAGYTYFSLQREVRPEDASVLEEHPEIRHFGPQLNDFADTAALCSQMDLVISVDTSVAHLAGALGLTTWVLIPFNPDWRWLLEREDSPWYPTMRLFRQPDLGEWQTTLTRLGRALPLTLPLQPTPATAADPHDLVVL